MNTDNTDIAQASLDELVDQARKMVAVALHLYADQAAAAAVPADRIELARAMADNLRGWTHTTRLRDFLRAQLTTDQPAAGAGAAVEGKASRVKGPTSGIVPPRARRRRSFVGGGTGR